MKRLILILAITLLVVGCSPGRITPEEIQMTAKTLDFGDQQSSTLTAKAWEAFGDKDYAELFAYTNKNIELYGAEARRMNSELTDFADMEQAFKLWALNDVGTSLYMQAEAYVEMEMWAEAAETYQTMADDYKYTQCWDKKGWFWKPAWGSANKAKKYRLKSK